MALGFKFKCYVDTILINHSKEMAQIAFIHNVFCFCVLLRRWLIERNLPLRYF